MLKFVKCLFLLGLPWTAKYLATFRTNNEFLLSETWESILVDAFFLLDEELLILNLNITLIDSIISIVLALACFSLLFSFKLKLTSVSFLKLEWLPSTITQSRTFVFVFRFTFDFIMYHVSIYCIFNVSRTIYINQHLPKCVQLTCVTRDQILSFTLSLTRRLTKWKVTSEICHSLDKTMHYNFIPPQKAKTFAFFQKLRPFTDFFRADRFVK